MNSVLLSTSLLLLFLSLTSFSLAKNDDDNLCKIWSSQILEKKTCNDITNQFTDKSASCCWYKGLEEEEKYDPISGCLRITNLADYHKMKAEVEEQNYSSEWFCNSSLDDDIMCDKQAPTSFEPKVCYERTEQFKYNTGYKCCWVKTTKAHDAYGCRRIENTEKGLKAIVNEGKINGARVDIQCEGGYLLSFSIVLLGIFLF